MATRGVLTPNVYSHWGRTGLGAPEVAEHTRSGSACVAKGTRAGQDSALLFEELARMDGALFHAAFVACDT